MIRYIYICDFSGREITEQQAHNCANFIVKYVEEHPGVPFLDQVCSEIWHEDYNDSVALFWDQKHPLILQIEEEKAARLKNKRKEYFKPRKVSQQVKAK